MSPREIAASALAVDSSSIASVEPIKHGLTNESWLVRTPTDAVVVRLSSRHWESLQIDRLAEAIVIDAVSTVGIGPPVLAWDLNRGILVTRYLGPTCEPAMLHRPEYIDRLGRVFRALHEMPVRAGVREVHLPTVIGGYLDTLQTLRRERSSADVETSTRALQLANEIAASSQPCVCHNDVHHLNLIDGDRLHLIDWEYAGIGEPFFDLASVCVYHEYSLAERERLLSAALGEPLAHSDIDRLAKCCWLFEYVRDLWTEVRAAVDTH
jgi:thiamine kinase-like enzyme